MALQASGGLAVELEKAPSWTSGPAQQRGEGGCAFPRRLDKCSSWPVL